MTDKEKIKPEEVCEDIIKDNSTQEIMEKTAEECVKGSSDSCINGKDYMEEDK